MLAMMLNCTFSLVQFKRKVQRHKNTRPLRTVPPEIFEPRGITPQDSIVFVIGIAPFTWASVEFWRRIAVGESFGTGGDSVIIGDDLNPASSRGRRVLGKVYF